MEKIKTENHTKKPITKRELQDALNLAVSDLQTVDYNNDTSLDDLETVDYNNNTSITDLAPIKKLETIDEENDEEDGLQVIKTVNSINIIDDEDEVKFMKKLLRNRVKRLSKNQLIRNQSDKINYPQILPQKKLIQKNKNQNKDIEYIKEVLLLRENV